MWVNLSLYPAPVPATELQPAAEEEQWAVVEVELATAPLTSPLLALEPASPPSAVLELEQGPTSAPAGVGAAELESPGPSFLVGSLSPPVAVKEREKKPNLTAFSPKQVVERLTVMDAVSSWALRAGWSRSSLCHCCPRPDPNSHDLGPNPSSTPYQPYDLGNFWNPQAFAVHLQIVEMDTNRTCSTEWLCQLHEVEEMESLAGLGPSVVEGNSLCAARSTVAQPSPQ